MYAFSIMFPTLHIPRVSHTLRTLLLTILTCSALYADGQTEYLEFDKVAYKDTERFIDDVSISIKTKSAQSTDTDNNGNNTSPTVYSIYIDDTFLVSRRLVVDMINVDGNRVQKNTYIIENSPDIFLLVIYKQPNINRELEGYRATIIEFDDDQYYLSSSKVKL